MSQDTEQPHTGDEQPELPALQRLLQVCGDAVLEVSEHRGDWTAVVAPQRIREICAFLRDDEQTNFNYLIDITAVDWPERELRFEVVYHLFSIPLNHMLRLKARVADGQPVDTVSDIWMLANWAERETYDMFGISFEGHPDLRRILLPEDWEDGFPLRKDYSIGGYGIWAADNVPFR